MGRAEDEAARAARRAAIRAEIARLREKIRKLKEYKSNLTQEHVTSTDNVHTPDNDFDLTVTDDISHWFGDLEKDGETEKDNTVNTVSTFMGDIEKVIETIDAVIARLEDEIDSLERELASI